eukprot:TRINITY_DN4763_c0_g1_i1.p1 TRINITY_DN4763_c0_g1~~TRINITY_DN4763_c0_g1_i1.p1  ORF type:complete len:214 (+),score=9.77 TRINITY_DN4763_c0_g1_i1:95-736(+)
MKNLCFFVYILVQIHGEIRLIEVNEWKKPDILLHCVFQVVWNKQTGATQHARGAMRTWFKEVMQLQESDTDVIESVSIEHTSEPTTTSDSELLHVKIVLTNLQSPKRISQQYNKLVAEVKARNTGQNFDESQAIIELRDNTEFTLMDGNLVTRDLRYEYSFPKIEKYSFTNDDSSEIVFEGHNLCPFATCWLCETCMWSTAGFSKENSLTGWV